MSDDFEILGYDISMGFGHTTNSSSCIHFIPPEVIAHPKVQDFLTRYGITGFVGEDPWDRRDSSILVTDEQKRLFSERYNTSEFSSKKVSFEEDGVIVAYGDEYSSIANIFAHLCGEVANTLGMRVLYHSYN